MRLTPTVRNWSMAVLAVALGAVALGIPTNAADDVAGSQGTDTSLPLTESAVTASGRGQFADLRITVNQTKNLTNQAVSLKWEGAEPTFANGRTAFAGNFLQIMQCWGEPDSTVPDNPGPPPEQCVAGATTAVYEGRAGNSFPANLSTQRQVSLNGDSTYDPSLGYLDSSGNVWREFRAVDGTVIGEHVNESFNPSAGGNFWLNPYFDINTTNEVAASATGADKTGIELFQVLTGVQSTGLGCGQRVQRAADGTFEIPKCWIVVVPRGTPEYENAGTQWEPNADERGVSTSPLAPRAWANRIAIPIEFNPVDSPCELAAQDRRLAGNELVAPAIASWQPLLCSGGKPPYSYAPVNDATARQILISGLPGAAGMVAVSRPLPASSLNETNPVIYAPLAASGLVIGFNLERIPSLTSTPEGESLRGVRVRDIYLTPRLVAKLLTQSYTAQVNIIEQPGYDWDDLNPIGLHRDPDFLRFNPEFAELQVFDGRLFSGLQLPAGTSDAARQVWEWILADPEAAEWLSGQPDQWDMRVNPRYATVAEKNSSGFPFGDPTPELFPKSDPYCYQAPSTGSFTPPQLCGTDWMPYARSFDEAALRVRAAADFARIAPNPFALTTDAVWSRTTPQVPGRRAILALTDTSSALRYGLQIAHLSRAGDDSDDREFVYPDEESLSLGLFTMKPDSEPQVLEPDPAEVAPGAYPLTSLTYAAATPLALDDTAREEYAAFLDYAAGPGQLPGLELGRLPRGYVPLPPLLVLQTLVASELVRSLEAGSPPPSPPAPTAPPTTDTPSTVAPPMPSATTVPVVSGSPRPTTPSSGGRSTTASSGSNGNAAPAEAAPASTEPEPVTDDSVTETTESPLPVEAESPPAAPTPSTPTGPGRVAVPVLGGVMLGSALIALELTKRPRRAANLPSVTGPRQAKELT